MGTRNPFSDTNSCVFLNTNAPTSGPRVRTLTLTAVARLTLLTWSVDWCYFELSAFLTWVWWLSCELDAAVCVTMIEHWPAVGPDLQQEHCSPVQSTKQIITFLGSDWFVYSLKSDLSWLSGWRPALSQPVSLRPGRRCLPIFWKLDSYMLYMIKIVFCMCC